MSRKKLVGVSSCLLGAKVRYDGGHKRSDYIVKTLGEHFDLQPFCPEIAAGLGVPRPPVRLLATDAGCRELCCLKKGVDINIRSSILVRSDIQPISVPIYGAF